MWYSWITTLAIWVYNEKHVVFADISNPNTSIFKIIDLIRPVDEWAEYAFSAWQNAEMTLKSTQDTSTLIKQFSLDMLTQDIKCGIRVLLL
jgi:hypothetical protein